MRTLREPSVCTWTSRKLMPTLPPQIENKGLSATQVGAYIQQAKQCVEKLKAQGENINHHELALVAAALAILQGHFRKNNGKPNPSAAARASNHGTTNPGLVNGWVTRLQKLDASALDKFVCAIEGSLDEIKVTDDAYGRASDATMPISDEEVCAHLDGTSAEDSREHLSELLIGSSFVATGPLLSLIDDSCCCCCCADGSSPTEVPSSPAELLIDLRTPRDQSGCT